MRFLVLVCWGNGAMAADQKTTVFA